MKVGEAWIMCVYPQIATSSMDREESCKLCFVVILSLYRSLLLLFTIDFLQDSPSLHGAVS